MLLSYTFRWVMKLPAANPLNGYNIENVCRHLLKMLVNWVISTWFWTGNIQHAWRPRSGFQVINCNGAGLYMPWLKVSEIKLPLSDRNIHKKITFLSLNVFDRKYKQKNGNVRKHTMLQKREQLKQLTKNINHKMERKRLHGNLLCSTHISFFSISSSDMLDRSKWGIVLFALSPLPPLNSLKLSVRMHNTQTLWRKIFKENS